MELDNCVSEKNYAEYLKDQIMLLLEDARENFEFFDYGEAQDLETGEGFNVHQIAGSYEGGLYSLIQRIMHYDGVLKKIFTPEQYENAYSKKDEWFDRLLYPEALDPELEVGEELDEYEFFRTIIEETITLIAPAFEENGYTEGEYQQDWDDYL